MRLSTKAAVFKRVSLVNWGGQTYPLGGLPLLGAGPGHLKSCAYYSLVNAVVRYRSPLVDCVTTGLISNRISSSLDVEHLFDHEAQILRSQGHNKKRRNGQTRNRKSLLNVLISTDHSRKNVGKWAYYSVLGHIQAFSWIGLKNNGGYKWMDGELFDFDNWHSTYPQNQECVYMLTTGEWIDDVCTEAFNLICKKDESKICFPTYYSEVLTLNK